MAQGPNGTQNKDVTIKPPIQPPLPNPSSSTPPSTTPDPKLYYESYDVMTGVRIAATLGGFFGLMVILVLYKSKSKTEKALEDPDFTAAAVAEVEKEERQLQAVLEATAYQQLNPKRVRRSLDAASPYAKNQHHNMRFSSIGGYSSLMEPPSRAHSRLPCLVDQDLFCEDDDKSFYNDVYYNGHLDVPRRPSNITCSSSGSSYLERRDSAVVLSLSTFSTAANRNNKSLLPPNEQSYDLYHPIDIRVTQPTPGGSPCGSDRAIYDRIQQQQHQQQQSTPELHRKLAPLASISSCNSSLATDYYPEYDVQSYTSDSVFNDDIEEINTENEVDEQFSTDSDINSDDGAYYGRRNSGNLMKKDATLNAINNRNFTKSSSTLVEESGDTGGTEDMPQLSFTERHSATTRKLSMSSGNIDSSRHQWTQETLF